MTSPEITPTRLARIRELFDVAVDLDGQARDAYLDTACSGDPALRREVEQFLTALERSDDQFEGEGLMSAYRGPRTVAVGQRIGNYELTRLIGFGGMGAVYEAVRADDQFRKRVAIKFLRSGVEGDQAHRRFRRERQILANLSHPNVTALLDGGVTVDGQPYIVMEYVAGEPITHYCDARQLGVRPRLAMLQQVFTAVQHAHQNLVVHRDLKPGNILVTEDGTVKLLDFGIAGLLRDMEGDDGLPVTQGPTRAYTPEYASPEQVRGLGVATSTDVYALGVIACELLSGHRPFQFDGKHLGEIQTIICQEPAPLPSSLVHDSDAPRFGERSAQRVRAQLRGDLDAIVLQALRKEPVARYSTVEQLHADIQRHIDGMPVSARRESLTSRSFKFVRRHRIESAAALLVLTTLVAGIVATTRAAQRAEREAAKVAQVNTFLANMLSAADPENSGRDVTMLQVLQQAAIDVEKEALDPEIEAQIRHTLAQTYYGLGEYAPAEPHARRAFELRRRAFGEGDFRTTMSLSYYVALVEARGEYARAESLARVHVDMQRRMPKPDPTEIATAMDNLARVIEQQGRLEEAMNVKLAALELRRLRNDSAALAARTYTLTNLSVSYQYQGEWAKAETLALEAIETEARVHGRRTLHYGNLLRNYASIFDERGRKAEADSVIRQSLDVLRAVAGPDHIDYLRSVHMHAWLRYSSNDMEGTVASAREVVQAIGVSMHESDATAGSALQVLGLALDSLRRFTEADTAFRRSLELRKRYMPPDHWAIASAESVLGQHLTRMGEYDDAVRILRGAYARLLEKRGASAEVTRLARERLEQAERLQQQARRNVRAAGTTFGPAPR